MKTLITACIPLIEHYKDELLVIDVKAIAEHPGMPFVHYARKWGTQLMMLAPHDHPCWPARGVHEPYLFGTADREHMLKGLCDVAEYRFEDFRQAHYFDGAILRPITLERAIAIVREHRTSVLHHWNRHLRPAWAA